MLKSKSFIIVMVDARFKIEDFEVQSVFKHNNETD